MSHKNVYFCHDFEKEPYVLDEDIEIIGTPGHTNTCISLIVRNSNLENNATVAIVGDLFEKEDCIFNESLWINAGTENEKLQRKNRLKVAEMAQYIIPGNPIVSFSIFFLADLNTLETFHTLPNKIKTAYRLRRKIVAAIISKGKCIILI